MSGMPPSAPPWLAGLARRNREHAYLAASLVRWIILGSVSGGLAGLSGWVFLTVLDRITDFRLEHDHMYFMLPSAGLVLGGAYHYLGGRAKGGSPLLIEQ
ncbi:MAG: hypothetical protein WCH93_10475, partial [Actinomycetota bacterium]